MIWENLQDRILQILLAGAAINLILGTSYPSPHSTCTHVVLHECASLCAEHAELVRRHDLRGARAGVAGGRGHLHRGLDRCLLLVGQQLPQGAQVPRHHAPPGPPNGTRMKDPSLNIPLTKEKEKKKKYEAADLKMRLFDEKVVNAI